VPRPRRYDHPVGYVEFVQMSHVLTL
jgi:hypothetical protein